MAALLPACDVYGRYLGPWRRRGDLKKGEFFILKRFLLCQSLSDFRLVPELGSLVSPMWHLRQYQGICLVLLIAMALLLAIMATLVSALPLLSMPESPHAGESIAAVSQLLGKDAVSAQAAHHFCPVSSGHSTDPHFPQELWVGNCLVGAQTSWLGLVMQQ